MAGSARTHATTGAFNLDVVLVGNLENRRAGLHFYNQPVRAMLGVGQKNHLRHQLFLNFIQVAPGQCGFYRRIEASGSKCIGHLRQTLGLLLDGITIGALHQFTEFVHLQVDDQALFFVEKTLAIGVRAP